MPTESRQQQDNEKALNAMQDQVATLRSLHEAVLERSSSISQLQRETDEHTEATRQDLNAMTGEMKKTVERFDFESRGLESVSQRVADVRGEARVAQRFRESRRLGNHRLRTRQIFPLGEFLELSTGIAHPLGAEIGAAPLQTA